MSEKQTPYTGAGVDRNKHPETAAERRCIEAGTPVEMFAGRGNEGGNSK